MQSESDSHFDEALLEKYAVGQLSDGQTALIEEHLLMCFECQVRLTGIDEYAQVARAAARELQAEVASPKSRLSDLWKTCVSDWFHGISGRGPLGIPVPMWAAGFTVLAVAMLIPHRPEAAIKNEVALSASRGANGGLMPHASPHSKILLKIDAATLPASSSYQVEVVDAARRPIWRGNLTSRENEIRASIPGELTSGRYWVRVSTTPDLKLVKEYGFLVD
jgi:hypothetical protein